MKNVITAILSSDHMKPQKQESDTGGGGEKQVQLLHHPPQHCSTHSYFCSDPFPNESEEFHLPGICCLFPTSGVRAYLESWRATSCALI